MTLTSDNSRRIYARRGPGMWMIYGDTYPHRDLLKAAGMKWHTRRRQWYIHSYTLPESVAALVSDVTQGGLSEESPPHAEHEAPQASPSLQLTRKPVPPPLREYAAINGRLPIEQMYIGQLSCVAGDCLVFGAAIHGEAVVYLDIAGSKTAVESAWATLNLGRSVRLVNLGDVPAHVMGRDGLSLQPEAASTLRRFQAKIVTGLEHLTLLHVKAVEPIYNERSTTYLIYINRAQAIAKLCQHINALVKVAVFSEWHTYLYDAGIDQGLIERCRCYGGVQLLAVSLDRDLWTRLITSGLERAAISLPIA